MILPLAVATVHLRKDVGVPAWLRACGRGGPDRLPKSSSWAPPRDRTENAINLSLLGKFCRSSIFFLPLFYFFLLLFLILSYFLLFVCKVLCKRILVLWSDALFVTTPSWQVENARPSVSAKPHSNFYYCHSVFDTSFKPHFLKCTELCKLQSLRYKLVVLLNTLNS